MMATDELGVRAVVLAAGASTRLGQPKQLLVWQGETLLNRALRLAREATGQVPVVVLGARAEAMEAALTQPAVVVRHLGWAVGMGSSIAAGVGHLCKEGATPPPAVLLLLTDQIYTEADLLGKLLHTWAQHRPPAVASSYANGRMGAPAVFGADTFADLMGLEGQDGAKWLLRHLGPALRTIPFPLGHVDVDTPEDWAALGACESLSPRKSL